MIAGSGSLPIEAAKVLRSEDRAPSVIAFRGLSDAAIENVAHDVTWLRFGELEPLADALKRRGNPPLLLLGKFDQRLVDGPSASQPVPVALDATVRAALSAETGRQDDRLLALVSSWFEEQGVPVLSPAVELPSLAMPEGCLVGEPPTTTVERDLEVGVRRLREAANESGAQCVVVRAGRVVAVEDASGTDAAISRAAPSDRPGAAVATVVKLTRPGQDLRFDLPAIGLGTIRAMRAVGAGFLVVEASASLVLTRDEVVEASRRHGISIFGIPSPWTRGPLERCS